MYCHTNHKNETNNYKSNNKLFVFRQIIKANKVYLNDELFDSLLHKFDIQSFDSSMILTPRSTDFGDVQYLDLELSLGKDKEIIGFDYFKV